MQENLIEELYRTREPKFDELIVTHPSIVATEIAIFNVLQDIGITADFVAGTSLGEFAAGVAGEVWSAEAAIEASEIFGKERASSVC